MKLITVTDNKKLLVRGFLALAILIVIIGVLFNFLRPVKIIEGGFIRLSEARTGSFETIIGISNDQAVSGFLGENAKIELSFSGRYERGAEANGNVATKFILTAEGESITMTVEGEARLIDDSAFLLIETAPPAFPPLFALKGQWVKLPRGGGEEASQLSEKSQIFTDIKRGQRIEVGGDKIKTYDTTATPEAVLKMVDSIAGILGTRLSNEQIKTFREGVASVESLPVTIGVTTLPSEIKYIRTNISLSEGNPVSIIMKFSNPSEPAPIKAPNGALSLEELVQQTAPAQ